MGVKLTFTEEVAGILVGYPWQGNVRELKNLAEYLAYLDKRVIEAKDIHPMLKWPNVHKDSEPSPASALPDTVGPDKEHFLFVLDCLHTSYQNKQRCGRRSLYEQARRKDLFLTEAQIRKVLTHMGDCGFVRLSTPKKFASSYS